MKNVYIVTRGDYSDYRIVRVFEDKTEAEKCAQKVGGDAEEWTLNQGEYLPTWEVAMSRDGEVRSIHADEVPYPDTDSISKRANGHMLFYFVVTASTEKKAIKIANERRAQYIANGVWERAKKQIELPPRYRNWKIISDIT